MASGRVEGKVAIVVGAGSGIGSGSALTLAREGARVVVADINTEGAERIAAEIERAGGEAVACRVDVTEEDSIEAGVKLASERWGRLDILHSNAATFEESAYGADSASDVLGIPLAAWERTMAVNLTGGMLAARHAVPAMLETGGGSIVFTSSVTSTALEPVRGAYGISKAGINALMRHIAVAYGKRGIRANAIAAGMIMTPERQAQADVFAPFLDAFRAHTLTPRHGTNDDVSAAVVYLASEESGYLTGQVIQIDGGMTVPIPSYSSLFGGGEAEVDSAAAAAKDR